MRKQIIIIALIIIFLLTFFPSNSYGLNDPTDIRVLVPGHKTEGKEMHDSEIKMVERIGRYDSRYDSVVIIRQREGWTDDKIKKMVREATEKAITNGRDVIVLVDMDLEELFLKHQMPPILDRLPIVGTKWFSATKWAGHTQNLVSSAYSDVFKEKGIVPGKKYLKTHSAGVDSVRWGLIYAKDEKMFDQIYLLNGRTVAPSLAKLLEKAGYTADEVSLFLTKGDFAALPPVPLHGGSISNLDAVLPYAGKQWMIFYGTELCTDSSDLCEKKTKFLDAHNALRNDFETRVTFEIYKGENRPSQITKSMEELELDLEKKTKASSLPNADLPKYMPDDTDDKKYFSTPFPPPCNPPCDNGNGGPGAGLGGVDFTDVHLLSIYSNTSISPDGQFNAFSYVLKAKKAEESDEIINVEDAAELSLNSFFTGLTLPESEFWVNLNPWEPDRIIEKDLETTDVGRIMLQADLQMKKDFSRYENPCESETGVEFWKLLGEKRGELVKEIMKKHPDEIKDVNDVQFAPVTRHWIVPDKVEAYETHNEIYIVNATLNIFSEPVYEQSNYNVVNTYTISKASKEDLNKAAKEYGRYVKELQEKKILPLVVQEVNHGRNYSDLRQVYISLTLAQWFKNKNGSSPSLFTDFIDSKNLKVLESKSVWSAESVWKDYKKSFEEGDYHCWKNRTYQQGDYTITESKLYSGGGVDFMDIKITNMGNIPHNLKESLSEAVYSMYAKEGNDYYFGDGLYVYKDIETVTQENSQTKNEATSQPEQKTPGFETIFAIAGLLTAAYLARQGKS